MFEITSLIGNLIGSTYSCIYTILKINILASKDRNRVFFFISVNVSWLFHNIFRHICGLADKMSHQFVFQLLLLCLFLFGHYCLPADDCDWSPWTDLDSDNMQHRAKDCSNGSLQIESRHCKHKFYDIPNGENLKWLDFSF